VRGNFPSWWSFDHLPSFAQSIDSTESLMLEFAAALTTTGSGAVVSDVAAAAAGATVWLVWAETVSLGFGAGVAAGGGALESEIESESDSVSEMSTGDGLVSVCNGEGDFRSPH